MPMNISGKIFSFLLSVMYFFTPLTPPGTGEPVKASDKSLLTFVAWADSQVSNYILKRDPYFTAACMDVENSAETFDALLIAGDVAENGLICEYEHIADKLPKKNIRNFLMATGNHDIRMRSYKLTVKRFTAFTNDLNKEIGSELYIDSLRYKTEINGYTFITLGSDKTMFEEAYLSEEQLDWLDSSLNEACGDKPVFVTVHQPFRLSHGLPDPWGSPFESAGNVGKQSDALKAVLSKYKNVILISGHLHTGIGQYTYEVINGIHSVNLPSLSITNRDGRVNDYGIGFWVEVFTDSVVFHARNFAQGRNIPEEDIVIKL